MENKGYTLMQKRKSAVREALIAALDGAWNEGSLPVCAIPDFAIEQPKDAGHGDFAANLAMLLAKETKMVPRVIAAALAAQVDCSGLLIKECQVAGPGFLNFFFKENWLQQVFAEIVELGEDFGKSMTGVGKKVQVEFVSANPTGELHMGNARGAAIGDTLANLLSMSGYEVEREFYINDAGNQIEKFGYSLEARYLQLLGQDVEFPDDGYHGEDITRTMQQLVDEQGNKFLEKESELRRELLIEYALEKKIGAIKKALADFGVRYDVWFSEQSLHDSGEIVRVLSRLRDADYLYEKEGATWLACTRFGEEKDEVLVRTNGLPTYFAVDIAYHDNKFQRGFDTVINIWGADHHGHVARMKGAMETLGYDRARLEILLMQFVRLIKDGEVVKMSKRSGTYVTLEELIEEIGVDAARFFFVMRSADSLLDVDMDLALSESSDNPVYYVQYAHARICSILANAKEQGYLLGAAPDCRLLDHESELQLIRKLADFPDEISFGASMREPHRLAAYVQELAAQFHNFYNHCRVLGEDRELSVARLWLAWTVAFTIKKGLSLMGVSAPEKM